MRTPYKLGLALGIIGCACSHLVGSVDWTPLNPVPVPARYQDAAYGHGVWVLGGSNVLATTADLGTSWTVTELPDVNDTIDGVLFTGERFLAYGAEFTTLTSSVLLYESTDGLSWNKVGVERITASGNAQQMRLIAGAVSEDGQKIVLGGFQGALYTSVDAGQTWTARIYIPFADGHVNFGLLIGAVVYGEGKFLLASHGSFTGVQQMVVSSSTDTITWTATGTGAALGIDGGSYGDGKFMFCGGMTDNTARGAVAVSEDGLAWTVHPQDNGIFGMYEVAYGNGVWVAAPPSPTQPAYSSDGTAFTLGTNVMGPTAATYGVAFDDNRFVLLMNGAAQTSTDGINWTAMTQGTRASLKGAAFGNGQLIAVGEQGTVLSSQDEGETWLETGPGGNGQMNAVTWTGDKFVAVGSSAWTSVDGATWNAFSLGGFFPVMNHLAYAGGTLVAGGTSGNLRRSTNGESWTAFSFNPANASTTGIAHGNGTWVVVGDDFFKGYILTSPDGEQWSRSEPEGTRPLRGLAYGNDVFVAIGTNAFFGRTTILVSNDGINWQSSELNMDPGKLAFDGQQFVHVGNKTMVSSNGTDWQEVSSVASPSFNFLLATDGRLLAFGNLAEIRTANLPSGLTVDEWNRLTFSWVYGLTPEWGISPYLGYVYVPLFPYIYQVDLGWMYLLSSNGVEHVFYNWGLGYILINEGFNGFYYVYATDTWLQISLP